MRAVIVRVFRICFRRGDHRGLLRRGEAVIDGRAIAVRVIPALIAPQHIGGDQQIPSVADADHAPLDAVQIDITAVGRGDVAYEGVVPIGIGRAAPFARAVFIDVLRAGRELHPRAAAGVQAPLLRDGLARSRVVIDPHAAENQGTGLLGPARGAADRLRAAAREGRDRTARDGDRAARAVEAAADARAASVIGAADGVDRAARDRDVGGQAFHAAADARRPVNGGGVDRAAVNDDAACVPLGDVRAVADARGPVRAGGSDRAGVDRDERAGLIPGAADARAAVRAAPGDNDAAVDRDRAGPGSRAADARADCRAARVRAVRGAGQEPARAAGLSPDGERIVSLHRDARGRRQRLAVAEDQVHIPADGDALADRRIRGHRVPAGCPAHGVGLHRGIGRHRLHVPARRVHIGHGDFFLDGNCAGGEAAVDGQARGVREQRFFKADFRRADSGVGLHGELGVEQHARLRGDAARAEVTAVRRVDAL